MYYYVKHMLTGREEIRWDPSKPPTFRDHEILGRVPTFREHQALENIRTAVHTHLEKVL